MSSPLFRVLSVTLAVFSAVTTAQAQTTSILFVGNSYTFGRTPLNPDGTLNTANNVLTYNSTNVRDLTKPQGPLVNSSTSSTPKFSDVTGTNSYPIGMNIAAGNTGAGTQGNSYSPHTTTNTWGGTAGIFKQFTVQAGLNYDVALSTRNAASLRGHFLNTANSTNWDLRGNISSQKWNSIVLQEQSDEALKPRTTTTDFAGRTLINIGTSIVNNTATLGSNYPSARAYVDLIEDWVHTGRPIQDGVMTNNASNTTYRERNMYYLGGLGPSPSLNLTAAQASAANVIPGAGGQFADLAGCVAAGGNSADCSNNTLRTIPNNANFSASTKIFLQETWARPDLINSPGAKTLNPLTSSATYDSNTPAPSYFNSLEEMTDEMANAMLEIMDFADNDGTSGITAVIPTGRSFLRAVLEGVATRDMYASTAMTDGLIDLWFNDGTHPSKYGSYLSALTTFQSVTGLDPRSLGRYEIAARDLGISENDAETLQRIAYVTAVPEPETYAMMLAGLGLMGAVARRRKAKQTA